MDRFDSYTVWKLGAGVALGVHRNNLKSDYLNVSRVGTIRVFETFPLLTTSAAFEGI